MFDTKVIKITRQHDGKVQFKVKVIKIGNSVGITLPAEIKERDNITLGDEIAIQAEYSDKHGEYASIWNYSQQQEKGESQ